LVDDQKLFAATPALEAGTTYYWRVDSYEDFGDTEPNLIQGAVWSFTTVSAAPTVTGGPDAFTLADGDVTLSITSENANTFKWYQDDVLVSDIAGKILNSGTENLTIKNADKSDEGYYYCVVSHTGNPGDTDQSDSGQIMTKRLVLHLDFEGDLADSASGLVGEYHTPNSGSGVLDPGEIITDLGAKNLSGKCISLPNNNSHINVSGADEYLANQVGFTASAFVRVDVGRPSGTVIAYQEWDDNAGWRLQALGTSPTPSIVVFQATDPNVFAPDISNGQWHMITGTFDGVNSIIYVDGVARAVSDNNVNTIDLFDRNFIIGAKNHQGQNHYYGMMDEVKVWNYPLGPDDIIQEYANTLGKTVCSDPDVVSYDLTDDCKVNIDDILKIAEGWLEASHIVMPAE
jgi:hypothetical protein